MKMRVWMISHPRWTAAVQGLITALLVLLIGGRHQSLFDVGLSIAVFAAVFVAFQLFRERKR